MTRTRAARLESIDKRHVWHPFTQMRDWQRSEAVVIERAEGNYLYDTRGRRYLDAVSSLWCNVHGHRVPQIDRAVRRQLDRVAHSTFLGLSNVPATELAAELVRLAPKGLTRVFYSDSGSAAVEVALKMAFQYWRLRGIRGKDSFLKLRNAYHGDTLGSVSVGGIDLFHRLFRPMLFKTYGVDAPYRYRDTFQGSSSAYARFCADKVEAVLRRHHRRIAAIVVEPLMQGAAGMLDQPPGYLRRVARLAKRYDVLLVVDEVATGFGRTGRMFACEHEGVRPDLLCVAKGITGGYLPLSATLATERIYRAFLGRHEEFKAFFHGHTYSGNPLAAAAALANLRLFRTRRVLRRLVPKIAWMRAELQTLSILPVVGDVRQKGLMAGIELVRDRLTKTPFPPALKVGARVCAAARRKGVLMRPLGNVIVWMPPLSVTEAQLRLLGRVTAECIQEVLPEAGR